MMYYIRALDKPAYCVNYENIRQDTHLISILMRIMYENHNQHYAFNIISKRERSKVQSCTVDLREVCWLLSCK